MEFLDVHTERESIQKHITLLEDICVIYKTCWSEGTNQRTLDMIKLRYPGYVQILGGCKSTESILTNAANVIRKIWELVLESIKRVYRFILSFLSDKRNTLQDISNNVDTIKKIRDGLEINITDHVARGKLEFLFKVLVDYNLFLSRYLAAEELEKKIAAIDFNKFYDASNSVRATARDHVLQMIFPQKDTHAKIGIKYNPDFSKMHFESIMNTDEHKRVNIYNLEQVESVIKEYVNFSKLSGNIYDLNKKLLTQLERCRKFGQKINDDSNFIDKGDITKIKSAEGAIHTVQEVIMVIESLSGFIMKDLSKIEDLSKQAASFVDKYRKKIEITK